MHQNISDNVFRYKTTRQIARHKNKETTFQANRTNLAF